MFLNPGSEGGGGREWRRPWRSNGEGRVWGGRGSVFIWGRKGSQRERRWLWPFIPALHSRLPGQQSSLILSAVGVHICSCLLRDMSRLCSISILIFLAVFITWRHELSTLWLCSPPPCTLKSLNCPPPTADLLAVRTRRQSRPRKSGRNPSCWFGGPLPTTGEGSWLYIVIQYFYCHEL